MKKISDSILYFGKKREDVDLDADIIDSIDSVIFFGSGPVAAKSLELLCESVAIEAVITRPAPEHHKDTPPVLRIAKKFGLTVHEPSNKTELEKLFDKRSKRSRVGIVIDYGLIIPKSVIESFSMGIINSHFSLLPEWRGADPISFSILSGQKKTGVSLMLINEGLDEGKLISQDSIDIPPSMTAPELTQKLIELSHSLLEEIMLPYLGGQIDSWQQDPTKPPTYSRKLTKEDGVLDFSKRAEVLEREIRAFIDWPKSRTEIAGKDVVVLKASVDTSLSGKPGQAFKTNGKKIGIYTKKGALVIEELKPAGKQAMSAEGFLAGYGKQID
jgi:methionyl-tRNA formyltransferase